MCRAVEVVLVALECAVLVVFAALVVVDRLAALCGAVDAGALSAASIAGLLLCLRDGFPDALQHAADQPDLGIVHDAVLVHVEILLLPGIEWTVQRTGSAVLAADRADGRVRLRPGRSGA